MVQGIDFAREKHVGIITLDRPEALNALSFPMIKAFYKQLNAWKKDNSIHAVVLKASSDRVFCAGGDIRWLYEAGKHQDPLVDDFFWHEYRLNLSIATFGKPYISLLNGITMGGGVGIGMHGSHPIATERFVFAMPETAIGLFPDVGASYLLSRLPGGLGVYLALTGKRLSAADAFHIGLIKYVVPEKSCEDILRNLIASDLAQDPMSAIDKCFDAVRIGSEELVPSFDQAHLQIIEHCFNQPSLAEVLKALDALDTTWSKETQALIRQFSPMSLKVTFLQMQKAKHLDLAGCLAMDGLLVKHFTRGHDLYEGIRALIIDKDKTPRWDPPSLEEITDEQVYAYFEKISDSY